MGFVCVPYEDARATHRARRPRRARAPRAMPRADADDVDVQASRRVVDASARRAGSPPRADRATHEWSPMYDRRDAAPRSVSARATPRGDRSTVDVRPRGDVAPNRLNFDDDAVRGALDRLAFHGAVTQVADAFGEVIHDATEEASSYVSKAQETLIKFQAAQHAAQWNPIESGLTMRPTYVKVPVSTIEQIKFWESEDVRAMKMTHLQEKQTILAENAGMRALLGEEASEVVQELRETEDGVNRALLLAAVEEITNLKTRVSVLEGEAAKQKVSASGYAGFFGGGGANSVDQAQMQKLTRELARLEENNSRMTWMLGEKEKQIKEVRAKYTESAAYALQEKLQECMEALEVASNLQGEQLQYLEQHALAKLEALDDQICDTQLLAESKSEHLAQLRAIMRRYFVDGDEKAVEVLTSLSGFSAKEGKELVQARNSRTIGGFLSMVATKLSPAVSAASSMIVACAPPTSSVATTDAALKTLGVEDDDDEAKKSEMDDKPTTPPTEDAKKDEGDGVDKEEVSTNDAPAAAPAAAPPPTTKPTEPERRRPTRASKKKSTTFAGFDDPTLLEKKQAERAKSRQPLPQPKLVGKAAERERAKRAMTQSTDGFAGFGDDPDASSDDD